MWSNITAPALLALLVICHLLSSAALSTSQLRATTPSPASPPYPNPNITIDPTTHLRTFTSPTSPPAPPPTANCSTSPYAAWMRTHASLLHSHSLLSLTLPGTHDSGSYALSTALGPLATGSAFLDAVIELAAKLGLPVSDVLLPWSLSQAVSVAGQLCMGARYLDVRAAWDGSHWRVYHGLLGATVAEVLQDVAEFVSRQTGEVVVVEVSHLEAVDGISITVAAVAQLNATIASTFGDLLYRPPAPSFTLHTIGQLVAMNQRVILSLSTDQLPPPLDSLPITTPFTSTALYNTYANTPTLAAMQRYNVATLLAYTLSQPHPASPTAPPQLRKLSYTLTPDGGTVLDWWVPGQPASLRALAGLAGGAVLAGMGGVGGWRRDGLLSGVGFGGLLSGWFGGADSGSGVIVLMDWFESRLVDECIWALQNNRTISLPTGVNAVAHS